MKTTLGLGKVYAGSCMIALSLLCSWVFAPKFSVELDTQKSSSKVESANDGPINKEQDQASSSNIEDTRPKPKRLDVITGSSGPILSKQGIHVLTDKQQDAFVRLITSSKSQDTLEVRSPIMTWKRMGYIPSELVLRRDSGNCVRLEDQGEPGSNYYKICLADGIIIIHTVGDLPGFS